MARRRPIDLIDLTGDEPPIIRQRFEDPPSLHEPDPTILYQSTLGSGELTPGDRALLRSDNIRILYSHVPSLQLLETARRIAHANCPSYETAILAEETRNTAIGEQLALDRFLSPTMDLSRHAAQNRLTFIDEIRRQETRNNLMLEWFNPGRFETIESTEPLTQEP